MSNNIQWKLSLAIVPLAYTTFSHSDVHSALTGKGSPSYSMEKNATSMKSRSVSGAFVLHAMKFHLLAVFFLSFNLLFSPPYSLRPPKWPVVKREHLGLGLLRYKSGCHWWHLNPPYLFVSSPWLSPHEHLFKPVGMGGAWTFWDTAQDSYGANFRTRCSSLVGSPASYIWIYN